MHFSNTLIDRDRKRFIVIDPRGYPYCDIFYDFGKIWHSVNGKYEFISGEHFEIDGTDFRLTNDRALRVCQQIKEALPPMLAKHSEEDLETTLRKTRFNEAVHFASLIPFLIDFDSIDVRAKAAYFTATRVVNEFVEDYL